MPARATDWSRTDRLRLAGMRAIVRCPPARRGFPHNSRMPENENHGLRPKVLIVGCGFGGLEAARALAHAPVDVTLVDRANHHLFQPLLYQVATAGLPAPAI